MSDIPCKNGWSLAERAGDRTPDKMQRLLNHAVWDEHDAMGIVGDFVVEHLGGPDAVAVLDETGQEKKGEHTAGVKRQYVGCAGQVTNAINIVYCTYASSRGHAHVGARAYLPKEWAGDPERRAEAGVPEDVVFQTKPQLAVDILTDLDTAGVLPPWVVGDEVYGRDSALRAFCEDRGVGYVLGVPCSFTVALTSRRKARADQARKLVPARAWNRASCGHGSKGDRTYAWAWIATASPRHHLLVRRNLKDPADQAYFYCYVPEGRIVTLGTLVTVAGMRWPVEEDFQVGKRPVRLGPQPAPALHRPDPPPRAHHDGPGDLRSHRRRDAGRHLDFATGTDHPRRRATRGPGSDPAYRWPKSDACSTCSPGPGTGRSGTCIGPGGDVATRPAPAGSINGHDSNAKPKQHDQVTKCGCRTRRR